MATTARSAPRLPLSALFPPPPEPGVPGDPGVVVDGAFRTVTAERATLLGGPAAILLQVAHPAVAAGVARHSNYTADPAARLLATLQAALTVTFGDTAQAHAAARAVGRRHAGVRGELPDGSSYRATDPDLALWVHVTLVRTAWTIVAERLRRPVDSEEFWTQSMPFARLFGVTAAVLPASATELQTWWQHRVTRLRVTPEAREIAATLLTQRTRPPLPGVARVNRVVTADLLPPPVREQYGLEPSPGAAAALWAGLRTVRPALPTRFARWPHATVCAGRTTQNQESPTCR